MFDRMVEIILESVQKYDLVIFDTAPTGHTLRLLSLPELMGVWIDGMLQRRRKTNELKHAWMSDGDLPEEDPIYSILNERKVKFISARNVLLDKKKTAFMFVLIPEKLPIIETDKALKMLGKHKIPVGGIYVNRVLPEEVEGHFLIHRKKQETVYIEEINAKFAGNKISFIRMLEQDVQGVEAIKKVSNFITP